MMNGKRFVSGLYGPLPGSYQSVPRAELFAITSMLRSLVKPARVQADHWNIILGIAKDRRITCGSIFPDADLWRIFWHLIDDLGGLGSDLEFVWVKAHSNDGSDASIGNNWADRMANFGASVHETDEEAVKHVDHIRTHYTQLVRWLGKASAHLSEPGVVSDRQPKADWPIRTN